MYSILDEVHQIYISCKSGEVKDILIYTSGTSIRLDLYLLNDRIVKREKYKVNNISNY